MRVTDAGEEHLAGIVRIYNDAVATSTAIWNDALVDLDNRRAWLHQRRSASYPVFVAVTDDDEVVGYASFGDFRPFDGYRHSVEHSVYVSAWCRRQGVATRLMTELISGARQRSKHVMIGAIESGNLASVDLHRVLGFREAGRMRQVGCKFGRWLDLTWMTLRLNDRSTP